MALRDNRNILTGDRKVRLRFHQPFQSTIEIRERGTDLAMVEEVLQDGVYGRVAQLLTDCNTIVDLGANIGLATLFLASKFPRSRIVSVEAHPGTFAVLQANVQPLTESGRCSPLNAAIWNESGRPLRFSAPHDVAFAGMSVSAESAHPPQGDVTVDSISMPDLLRRYKIATIDLLKIDIEGAEVELLSGDISWLKSVRYIAIEFHGDSRERSRFDAMLPEFEFRVVDESPHTVIVSREAAAEPRIF